MRVNNKVSFKLKKIILVVIKIINYMIGKDRNCMMGKDRNWKGGVKF